VRRAREFWGVSFLVFLVLWRLLLLPWFLVPLKLDNLLSLELRRRLRLLEGDVDLLRVDDGNVVLLVLLLIEDWLMDILDTLSRLGFSERNRSEEVEDICVPLSLSSPPPPPPPNSSESEVGD